MVKRESIDNITKDDVEVIINTIEENYKDIKDVKPFVIYVKNIWEKIHFTSPGKLKSIILFFIYIFSFVTILFAATGYIINSKESKIVTKVDSNGKKIQVHQIFFDGKLASENSISDSLYHGYARNYNTDNGKIAEEGEWYKGKWHSVWKFYDENGTVNKIIHFDKGKFIHSKELINGDWVKKNLKELSEMDRKVFLEHEKGKPQGPDDYK